jgi:predicted ATPase
VIVSEDTRKLVEDYFALRHLGPATLKGIAEPVNVYEVMSAGPLRGHFGVAARRGLTRFVGREAELEQLKRLFAVARSGRGQIVSIVADAGTGKSRLVYEFKATIPDECRLLEAYSVSHGKASPWLPVVELLRAYFGLQDADDTATRRENVRASLAALESSLDDTPPYLWNLLSIQEVPDPLAQMDARIKRQRTLEALKRILLRESLKQPVVIIFEDLHWIDEQTQDLLNLLADSIGTAKILLLVNHQPEYRHDWGQKTYYTQVRLDPLGKEGAEEMLEVLLGKDGALAPVRRIVIERTEGNPFFIEEMVQTLFEQHVLAGNGSVKLAKSLSEIRVSTTVQGVLASRIDRLPPAQKELLQTVSIIGRKFPVSLVRRVLAAPDNELQQMLGELQLSEFIYEQPPVGEVEYIFKHALTHEVAMAPFCSSADA